MNLLFNHRFIILSTLLLTLGLAWICVSRVPEGTVTAGRIPAPHTGFLAPDFSLPDAEGQVIRLSDLRGRAVIINLWASWCVPCRTEMPALERVYRDYATEGLALLAVNATSQDSRSAAQKFAVEQGLTFPILFDEQGEVSRLYALNALPTTIFLDSSGVIRDVIIGGPMAESLLRVRVEQLLESSQAEKAGRP